ncbi:MAG: hypothetical protein IFK94_11080 [Acidobacteria bacterium]|uniref:Uncharacterized protein n=1 Tax=Candidatus Polarisedimenticola svalbardensis TaxID=2886004 RepID=A0A8J6Y1U9_9BACT|nr:hypothetical protein [Candidatus Polarisedimenticola svalbardensis]
MRHAVLILLLLLIPALSMADAELVLEDGQVIKGTELERKDDLYILHLATGGVLTLPAGLVKEFRLTVEGEPEEKKTAPTGVRETGPEELSGSGSTPRLPRMGDQIEAFDKPPARFRNNIVDSSWRPESDWTDDPDLNNFNPSRWYKAPIDSTWRPESSYDDSVDVFRGNRSSWQRSIVDSTWTPSDGFAGEEISLVPREEYVPLVTFEP